MYWFGLLYGGDVLYDDVLFGCVLYVDAAVVLYDVDVLYDGLYGLLVDVLVCDVVYD